MSEPKVFAILRNYVEPVEVTSIDFVRKTFTWNYRGHLENVEALDDAELIFSDQSEIQHLREEAERANKAANIKEECRLELQTEVERLRNENAAQAEEIKRLQRELQGIGVEQYYALHAKCREQEAEIRALQVNRPKRKCMACNGSGRYDSFGSPPCGACDGTGEG